MNRRKKVWFIDMQALQKWDLRGEDLVTFTHAHTHTHTHTHKHTQRTCEELTEQRNLGFVAQLVKNLSRVWAWGRKLVKK